jgi:capsular polysaccharide biosynthesis protein
MADEENTKGGSMHESREPERRLANDEIDLSDILRKIWIGRVTLAISLLICLAAGLVWTGYRTFLIPAAYESKVTLMIESSTASQDDLFLVEKNGASREIDLVAARDSINPELLPLIVAGSPFLTRIGNLRIQDPKTGSMISVAQLAGQQTAGTPVKTSELDGKITAKSGPGHTLLLQVIMPDPVVAATVADSAAVCLTPFIFQYSTSRAIENLKFVTGLQAQADSQYMQALQAISAFHTHTGTPLLASAPLEEKRLQAAYRIALDRVGLLSREAEKARFRIQSHTPAITIMQPATPAVRINIPNLLLVVAVSLFAGLLAGMTVIYFRNLTGAPVRT